MQLHPFYFTFVLLQCFIFDNVHNEQFGLIYEELQRSIVGYILVHRIVKGSPSVDYNPRTCMFYQVHGKSLLHLNLVNFQRYLMPMNWSIILGPRFQRSCFIQNIRSNHCTQEISFSTKYLSLYSLVGNKSSFHV